MSKRSHFTQLKKLWNLPDDTSLDELLAIAKDKLEKEPENPEFAFNVAEILRHQHKNTEAQLYYKKSVAISDDKTDVRAAALSERVKEQRTKKRRQFLFYSCVPLLFISLISFFLWKSLTEPEKLPADSNPQKFAFTQWLAKQQMAEVMTTLQQQNPELSFDFSSSSSSAQSPMEFMQSLMAENAIEKMKSDQQQANNRQDGDGEGHPAFQCSKEPAMTCAAHDIPSAPGESREEVVQLMESYTAILKNEKDCTKIEQSINAIGKQLQWRKSERQIKANLEDLAMECFYREKNLEKVTEHARKLQCTGVESYINSVYWYLTAMHYRSEDPRSARTSYECFNEATQYIQQLHFSPSYVASRHRESGALAWLYFDDLDTATSELIKGRDLLKRIPVKTAAMMQVISEINLDLMETYVTANIDRDTFDELMEEINSSGLLTDGYKQIKDTLAAIYYMQNEETQAALQPLSNIRSRFGLMPEFICGWDWSGFQRGLNDSIPNANIREQANILVDTANCYMPQSMTYRIQKINSVSEWLRKQ